MKVFLYSRDFFPSVGGVQTIVAELTQGLAGKRSTSDGCERIELTLVTRTQGSRQLDEQFPYSVVRQPAFWTMARLIHRADIVHLAGPAMAPLVLALFLGKPVVVEHHGFQSICPNGQLLYAPRESTCPGHYMAGSYSECLRCNREKAGMAGSLRMLLLTPLRRWLCNRTRVNIAPTHWLASQLKLKHLAVVLHGVSSIGTESKVGGPDVRSSTFAYQGRLVSTKGIRVLLKAFQKLCDEGRSPRLIIIGSGPEEESLKQASARLGKRVQFLGDVPNSRLERELAQAGSIVMPSLAGEVFGLVAAENMLRGKLVIASDLGSLREIVGEAGLLFPVGDAAALADCMRLAMDDLPRVRALVGAAQSRASQIFESKRMIQEHISVYREALRLNGH